MYTTSATLSDCGLYRYRLRRRWSEDGPTMGFIMLNPSTADHEKDDPTIRRCIGFAKRENCGGIIVLNLYALRSPDPRALLKAPDPHGEPLAEFYRRKSIEETDGPLVAAWGSWPNPPRISFYGRDLMCLGRTKNGSPRHPLYVPADQPLEKYDANKLYGGSGNPRT